MQTSFTNFADLASHIAAARENEDLIRRALERSTKWRL